MLIQLDDLRQILAWFMIKIGKAWFKYDKGLISNRRSLIMSDNGFS